MLNAILLLLYPFNRLLIGPVIGLAIDWYWAETLTTA